VTAGRLYQLRRGLYALAPPYQRTKPHPFVVANSVVRSSYVSLQAALAYYSLIPEATPVVTSVTTGRPGRWETPLGAYEYRHVKLELFFGYRLDEVSPGQQELRLQNLERLDVQALQRLAEQAGSPKLQRAAYRVADLVRAEAKTYEDL
jgi:predicted transcriptional regulator of viral defense system